MIRYLYRKLMSRRALGSRGLNGRTIGSHDQGSRPHGGRARAFTRVLAYLTFVSFGFTFLSLRSVYGRVRDVSLEMGRDLLRLKDILGPAQALMINGTTVFVGARHVDAPVREVISRFETYCEDESGNLFDDLGKLDPVQRAELPAALQEHPNRLGVLRADVGTEAALACIAAPPDSRGLESFVARARAAMETGDFGKLGRIRYIFARQNERAGGTDVLTLWNEGPFNIMQMLFSDRDVPGNDAESVPRPPGSVRVLSAEVPGTGYGMRAYATAGRVDQVLEEYERSLPLLGWTLRPAPDFPDDDLLVADVRTFTKDDAAIFIMADEQPGRTVVQIVEMGTRGSIITRAAEP